MFKSSESGVARSLVAGAMLMVVLITAIAFGLYGISQSNQDPVVVQRYNTSILSRGDNRWEADIPGDLLQEWLSDRWSDNEEAFSAMATIPDLIQQGLRGDDVILLKGN